MPSKKARIIVDARIDGVPYTCNTLIEADAARIKSLVADGAADDSKAAVDYLIESGQQAVVHQPVAESVAAKEPDATPVEN